MCVGAFVGFYSFSPFVFPVFTWSGIGVALHLHALFISVSRRWLLLPYIGIGGLAVITGFLGPNRYNIAVGAPLILIAALSQFWLGSKPPEQNKAHSPNHTFSVGDYKLDAPVAHFSQLKEFSESDYSVMGRPFEGEIDYNAPPVSFLGQSWQLQLGTVNGKVYKIASYLRPKNLQDANEAALKTLQYCSEELGKPTEQRSGFFIWDTTDGNVILQTDEAREGFFVNLFLTSSSVKTFKRR